MKLNPADRDLTDDEIRQLFSGAIVWQKEVSFYLDENMMSTRTLQRLRHAGVRILTVVSRGLVGQKSDVALLLDARRQGCIFVTYDRGFEILHHRLLGISGAAHAGILHFGDHMDEDDVATTLDRLADKWSSFPEAARQQLIKFG